MCFVPQGRACLLSLISPDGSAPAALVILLFDPPEPQNIGKHSASRLFYLFAPLDLLSSSFLFSDLLSSDSPFSESSHLCCCICPFCRKLHFLTSFEKYIKKYIKILYIYIYTLKNMFFKYTQRSGEETLLLGHTAIPRGCWLLFPFSCFSFAHVCLLERQRKPFKSDAYKMYKDRKSWKQRLYVRDLGHQTKRSSLDQAFWPWNTLNNYIMPSHRSPFESDACKDKGRKKLSSSGLDETLWPYYITSCHARGL